MKTSEIEKSWNWWLSVCLCSFAGLTGIDYDVLLCPTDATRGSLQFHVSDTR